LSTKEGLRVEKKGKKSRRRVFLNSKEKTKTLPMQKKLAKKKVEKKN
jgi:hypothetical protein